MSSTPAVPETRVVDWSFPMNPSHLPPKSPGSFPILGTAGALPSRAGHHKRTPSAGFLPQTDPTWMDGVVGTSRAAHRRSASESMAFLADENFSNMLEENVHEEDDYGSLHSGGGSLDFDRLDENQLISMFGNESEPNPNLQHHFSARTVLDATWTDKCSDTWASGSGRLSTKPFEPPSTPSDSNSLSDVSNEDPKGEGLLGKEKSEPDVQSANPQLFSKGELQQALAGLDSSLDPKRAKRILANRQSAQRSRVRKLQYISELERSVTALQSEISALAPQVAFFEHRRAVLNVDNNSIKQKTAALVQGQLFKDADNDALQKEVQRLRQLYQQQQHPNMQHSQLGMPSSGYDLHHQHFDKLESGTTPTATPQGDATLAAVPDVFASGYGAGTDSTSSSSGSMLLPAHLPRDLSPQGLNTMVGSTW